MLIIVAAIILHWYLSLFSQTFFQHRYAAHRAFTMSKSWERFFYIFSYFAQGSSYLSPRAYGIMHRMHHAYADTERDPHSPSFDKNLLMMMWRTKKHYANILFNKIEVEEKFSKNLPDWRWFDLWGHSIFSRVIWASGYVWFYYSFAPTLWLLFLVPIHVFTSPIHGAIINWYAHKYGHVNFETGNTSKNLFALDLFMLGEAYHNNHHKFPGRSNFAVNKGEFDFCYPFIYFLQKMKIIKLAEQKVG